MWLEQMAWMWLPMACAFTGWTVWRIFKLGREVRTMGQRIEELEHAKSASALNRRGAA